ncbi:alcohol dehydrogenase catalytic domain-containing protein [uncultured Pseudokineococcus sp.]|uniref:alcohol dehydrogenase catalytic domain-containing protein n=1 Tax=uncultured Pseudokineococcus sp. TaxID=1642928 RepID=UPI002601EDFC|nr:alcohol dehydrogenase catalytic domain-containing protein [uncultured Pseudokineococcus sp.]
MRAARLTATGSPRDVVEVVDVDDPRPGPGEVLVRVGATGVCATELHFLDGLLPAPRFPVTLGHEVAGTVEAVGEGVAGSARPWAVGDRVAVHYLHSCGDCRPCRAGRENLCAAPRGMLAFASDGGFAELLVVPARSLARVPDGLALVDAAPVTCSVTTALHAAAVADVRAEQVVVVHGTGGVGLALVQVLRRRGARVVAVARSAARREAALGLGAEWAVDPAAGDVGEQVQRLTGGADLVVELVGTQSTGEQSLRALAPGGAVLYVGYSAESLTVSPLALVVGEHRVLTAVSCTMAELELGLDLVARGEVRVLVDRTVPLEELPDVLDALAAGEVVGRAVVVP